MLTAEEENQPSASSSPPTLALALVPAGHDRGGNGQSDRHGPSGDHDPMSVFKTVLERPGLFSDPGPAKVTPKKSRVVSTEFAGFLAGLSMAYDDSELNLLKSAEKQEPLNHGYKSQLQRANKAVKDNLEEDPGSQEPEEKAAKKPKAKAKPKAKPTPKAKSKGSKGIVQTTKHVPPQVPQPEDEEVAKPEKKKLKTPMKKKPKKKKVKNTTEVSKEAEKIEAAEAAEASGSTNVPDGFDKEATRATNRKRFTSRAWHREFDSCPEDMDPEDKKAQAREASKLASQEFERLWPKEPPSKKSKYGVKNGEDVNWKFCQKNGSILGMVDRLL